MIQMEIYYKTDFPVVFSTIFLTIKIMVTLNQRGFKLERIRKFDSWAFPKLKFVS